MKYFKAVTDKSFSEEIIPESRTEEMTTINKTLKAYSDSWKTCGTKKQKQYLPHQADRKVPEEAETSSNMKLAHSNRRQSGSSKARNGAFPFVHASA